MLKDTELLEFYGRECHFCNEMKPLVDRLEKELSVKIEKFEVWHDEKNAKLLQKLGAEKCDGVPFFLNTKSGKFICGATTYDALKEWALA